MCGIAGVLGEAQPGEAERMVRSLEHRGPDGVRLEDGPGFQLAHARLSIIDLQCGWQPLHAAGSTVIGNGEIYNYLELTHEFRLSDRLATGSDFEPLLHLYANLGPAAFERLRGMYAFCLIGCDGRVWLVRDPFGIKPIYYAQSEGRVAFASEPRALVEAGLVAPAIEPAAAEQLLALNYVVDEDGTTFRGVRRLAPGEIVEIVDGTANPFARLRPFAPIKPAGAEPEDGLLDRLDQVLEDSVRVHQRSDVPYGLFLSGGIDSAAIAVVMARLNQRPVTAFTCGFEGPGARDERAQAERLARALKLDWRETTFGEAEFWRTAALVAAALDDPTSDYAALPTYRLAEAAKGTLTVVLSGEGGDEVFGGYGRYRRALRPAWLGGRPAEPQAGAPYLKDHGAAALAAWRDQAKRLESPNQTALQNAQAADIATWLPADLLLKLDRCLMAHGLEGRTPFLDREVAALALPLPDRMKVRRSYGKWILRKWLQRACPAADPWAKKKGFTVPVEGWIAPRAADLGPRIAANEGLRQVCNADAVRTVFSDERQAKSRWPLLFYALWWSIHIGRATPGEALEQAVGAL